MHVFLTNDPYVGKKTAVKTIADRYGKKQIGGFISYFGLDDGRDIKSLYMCEASSEPVCDEDHVVAYFFAEGLFRTLTSRFNENAAYINETTPETKLIIMNECSYLESEATEFTSAVLNCLDGDIPVFGVFKTKNNTWTKKIIEHPKVLVIDTAKIKGSELIEKIIGALGK